MNPPPKAVLLDHDGEEIATITFRFPRPYAPDVVVYDGTVYTEDGRVVRGENGHRTYVYRRIHDDEIYYVNSEGEKPA